MEDLKDIGRVFNTALEQIKQKSENYWNSLTKEQQLDAFCAISRRIYRGEIEQQVLQIEEDVDRSSEGREIQISLELELAAIVALPLALRHVCPEQDGKNVAFGDQVVRQRRHREQLQKQMSDFLPLFILSRYRGN